MLFIQHDQRACRNSFGRDPFAVSEFVIFWNDKKEFFVEEGFDFQVLGKNRECDNRKINFAMAAALNQVFGGVLLHNQGDIGVRFSEAL